MTGGWFIVLILWIEWAIPGRFVRGIDRSRKAISLAEEALGKDSMSECLLAVRTSVLQSFLFKTYLRFDSKTMRVPDDEQGILVYFRRTFLPEHARRLDLLSGWRSRLSLGFSELLLMTALVALFIFEFGWVWIAWLAGAVIIITCMTLFYHFYDKLIKKEREYALVLMELDLKLDDFEV